MRLGPASVVWMAGTTTTATAMTTLPKSSLPLPRTIATKMFLGDRTSRPRSLVLLGQCDVGGLTPCRAGDSLTARSSKLKAHSASCHRRSFVSLHGTNPFSTATADPRLGSNNSDEQGCSKRSSRRRAPIRAGGDATAAATPPPDPSQVLASEEELRERVEQVAEWMKARTSVLCVTGAGISTESGVPDYRGHDGAYLRGHKPMLHGQFVESHQQRQRYWGRGMVGWRSFRDRHPNRGHEALAALERIGRLGVRVEDSPEFYRHAKDDDVSAALGTGPKRSLSIVTQNVDSLHQRAGSRHVLELHGRTDKVRCMSCGATSGRNEFHDELERINADWLANALSNVGAGDVRPDGDAETGLSDYSDVQIPACPACLVGFVKPDVVFFGDTVPRHRVALCASAVAHADGLLVVGTSLAVHSAFRHVRTASQLGVPICIVNVGETRAEAEGLSGILKVEAPAGPTLSGVVDYLSS